MNLQRLSPQPSGQGSRAAIDTQSDFRKRSQLNAETVSFLYCVRSKRQSTNGKEFDTYKVGTVANSCSTMHKITSYPITEDFFSIDEDWYDLIAFEDDEGATCTIAEAYAGVVEICESLRQKYLESKDKRYWRALISILPSGWMQKRTVTLNYQVLRAMYFARRHHKLQEWHDFCAWIESLPYAKELICYEK